MRLGVGKVVVYCPACASPVEVDVQVAKVRSDGRDLVVEFTHQILPHKC